MIPQLYIIVGFIVASTAVFLPRMASTDHEVSHQRTYMYVGGQYSLNEDGEHILTDQMYVEKLTPAAGVSKPYPIVFIHGAGQTGTVRSAQTPGALSGY